MLAEPDFSGKRFSELLLKHGPIVADEVSYLADKAAGAGRPARVNATRLLGLAGVDAAKPALRKLVAETDDDKVFALALGPLLDEPDAKQLAASRPKLVEKALREEGAVVSYALRAAFLANLPGVADELARALSAADAAARDAATALLAQAGAGPLEPRLREILLDPQQRKRYSLTDIYQALSLGDDPANADAIRKSLQDGGIDAQLAFSNAVSFGKSRKPWLRALLLELASTEGTMQWALFRRIMDWGPEAPMAELVKICADYLRKKLPKERTGARAAGDFAVCSEFLGGLAGRKFGLDQLYDALDFASKWAPN
jgi:hypothetical protein